ncbi:hypothetical protein [Acinetobacter populi]|uniref:Uncharacterized protein n=1 Tax=Acinetobacter populi TaxID=1582270 RepID=A0A1Z9Z1F5_9GAMM|nr:hypothetical protein [Acinetobacter populi]OUY08276.1 hypothetical protein CAP51_01245 [Acinetobacter populi]
MHIIPLEKNLDIETYQYAIIDQALVGVLNGYEEVKISLAPEFSILEENIYPVLIDLTKLDNEMRQELYSEHQSFIKYYQQPLLSILFTLKQEIAEDKNFDLKKYFHTLFYYKKSEKFYLRRLYDPRVILQLNWYDDQIDLLNLVFSPFECMSLYHDLNLYSFKLVTYREAAKINLQKVSKILENIDFMPISYANRLVNKLNIKDLELGFFAQVCKTAYTNLQRIQQKSNQQITQFDIVALLFHMQLLGVNYLQLDQVLSLLASDEGYDQASKALDIQNWEKVFQQLNVSDMNLKNRVIYES